MTQYTDRVSSDTMLMALGVTSIVAFVWIMYREKKGNPNLNIGEIISGWYLTGKESVFILGAIGTNFVEGLFAASITPIGQAEINPLSRFGAHMLIAFIAMAAAMYFSPALKDLVAQVRRKDPWKEKWSGVMGSTMFLIIMAIGTIGLPLGNLMLIANGTGQVMQSSIFIYSIAPWISPEQLVQIKMSWGQSANYSPFSNLHYGMSASTLLTSAHFFLMIAHTSVIMTGKRKVYSFLDSDDTTDMIDKKDKREKEKAQGEFSDTIKFLLSRMKYSGNTLGTKLKEANLKLDSCTDANKANIAMLASKLKKDIKHFDANEKKKLSGPKVIDAQNALRKRIFNFFAGKTSVGKGLGMPIKYKPKK